MVRKVRTSPCSAGLDGEEGPGKSPMNAHACMPAHTPMHRHTNARTHARTHARTRIPHAQAHTQADTPTPTHRHTRTQTHRHTRDAQTHRHTRTQTHRHTVRQAGHTHTHTHTHVPTGTNTTTTLSLRSKGTVKSGYVHLVPNVVDHAHRRQSRVRPQRPGDGRGGWGGIRNARPVDKQRGRGAQAARHAAASVLSNFVVRCD